MTESVQWAHSTCPHDCPSTCALEVEVVDSKTIGRVRGRKGHPYTDGVICGKVSRYADRVHHPHRLMQPLKRIGPKGVGLESYTPISWEQALDETATAFQETAKEFGSESVWPYFYAGTMGHVQRDGIDRLRHEMRYSGQHSTFCITLADSGWNAGTGKKRGTDGREIAECELLVVWGGNPVNTQINVMHQFQKARRARNAKLVVVDPYRTDTAEKADLHLKLRPGTDGALACAVMHVLFEENYADWDYLEQYTDCPQELREHLKNRDPQWASAKNRNSRFPNPGICQALRQHSKILHAHRLRFHPFPKRCDGDAFREQPPCHHWSLEIQGRWCTLRQHGTLPTQQDNDLRAGSPRSENQNPRPVPDRSHSLW